MTLEKITVQAEKVEILEHGQIQIRDAIRVIEDGKILSQSFHRHCLMPGDDTSNECQKVKDIAASTWTQDILDAWNARQTEEQ